MKGDEPMTISWTFHGESGADPSIITTPIGNRGSMLVISSVGKDHNGNYTCTAKNQAGTASDMAVLKVNGKLTSNTGRHSLVHKLCDLNSIFNWNQNHGVTFQKKLPKLRSNL